MKGFGLINETTSTGCKLTDKMKLFVILVKMLGPIPAKNRADRMAIAGKLACSERTVFRVLSGVKTSTEVDFDNRSKVYKPFKSRLSVLEQIKDLDLPINQITDESFTGRDADRRGQVETISLDTNGIQFEDQDPSFDCPSAFGKKPEDFPLPCLRCSVDEECLRATQAADRDDDGQGQAETIRLDANRLQFEDQQAPLNCPREFGKKPEDFPLPCLRCPVDEECLAATQAGHRMELDSPVGKRL